LKIEYNSGETRGKDKQGREREIRENCPLEVPLVGFGKGSERVLGGKKK